MTEPHPAPQHAAPVPARRRAIAALAAAAGAAIALACVDRSPATVTGPATAASGLRAKPYAELPTTPAEVAWVGEGHRAGMRAVAAAVAAAGLTGKRGDAAAEAEGCALVVAAAARYLGDVAAGRALPPAPDAARALMGGGTAAVAPTADDCAAGARAAADGIGGALRSAAAEGRALAGAGAHELVDEIDRLVEHHASAAALDVALLAVERAAAHLADSHDRTLVWTASSTARASAYDVEAHCGPSGCVPYGTPPRDDADQRAVTFPGWRPTVRADVRGCIDGALRYWGGGAPGIAAGCLGGAMVGSAAFIWQLQ